MKLKELQLDFEALLSQAFFGHGFVHYGYWPEGNPAVPSAQALGQAQQAYFDLLARSIPEGVESILDVGSGTGANALLLDEAGYRLECLCPSEKLNQMARAKLPECVPVHTLKFEDFETEARFDMCLFAESFHYIELAPALAQAARYASRYILIFDYFRRESGESGDDTRGSHADFLAELTRQGRFGVVSDEDMTAGILPTFFVLDYLKNTHSGPFVRCLQEELRRDHPVYSALCRLFFGKMLRKLQRRSNRHETFAQNYEYRLILLERSGNA